MTEINIEREELDERGRLQMSDEERARIRNAWQSPMVQDVLQRIKRDRMAELAGHLRTCRIEQVEVVRAHMDEVETWFATLELATMTEGELKVVDEMIAPSTQMEQGI